MYDPLNRFLRVFITLLIPLILIIGVIRTIPTDTYLSFEYHKASFPPDSYGFYPAMRFVHAAANLKYVRQGQPISALAEQKHNQAPLYNSRELKHMQDLRNVYRTVGRIWYLAIFFFLIASLTLWMRTETPISLFPSIKTGGLLTVGIVLIIGLLAVVGWQLWFVVFHEVFFTQGSWTFNLTDTLIRLFPEKFWFDTAIQVSAASLAAGLALFLFSLVLERFLISGQAQYSPIEVQR